MYFDPQCRKNGGLVLRTTVVGSGGKDYVMLHLSPEGNSCKIANGGEYTRHIAIG